MKKFMLFVVISVTLTSCEQFFAKRLGTTATIKLDKGQKLIEVTWKEDNIWYLTEDMDSDYIPKTKVFRESSMYGILEGKVIFIEDK